MVKKGITIPPGKRSFGWSAMQVGDRQDWALTDRKNVFEAASQYKRRNPGWNYTTRVVGKTLQIWRTA